MNIDDKINIIRESIYGADVREAIADSLETAYKDSRTSVSMEVGRARGDYETLGERLDSQETEMQRLLEEAEQIDTAVIVSDTVPDTLEDGQICIVYENEEL